MKKIMLASLLLFATPVFAAQISLSCLCSYDIDGLRGTHPGDLGLDSLNVLRDLSRHQIVLAPGTSKNPSADQLADCKIKNGKVVEGCWAAKLNAQVNCQSMVKNMISPGSIDMPIVRIDDNACYGAIEQ